MNLADQSGRSGAGGGPDGTLLAELGREDRVRLSLGTVLPHLVDDDAAALAEEPVIRTRGLIAALAADLLRDCDGVEVLRADDLARSLAARPALLAHCHSLALEAGVAERLAAKGLDPVLSPLFEELLAADHETAQLAMGALMAQSRFASRQRRFDMVAAELPAQIMHDALVALADQGGRDHAARLRAAFDEGGSRLSFLARLALLAVGQAERLLDPATAGIALFATALSQRAGVGRDEVILASAPGQHLRLALLMRSAGVALDQVRAALALIHPDAQLPGNWEELSGTRAAALLAGEGA